ncbi:MAG TPA: hypothetical protein PL182_03735 [Pseudobdellovibrionaceae bacterium]|nr:hypothetical protein [Pseudobdellovibrionaceae bacterium]
MKSWALWPLAVIFVSACASKPQPAAPPGENGPQVIYLKDGDRQPAGEPTIEWEKDVQEIEVNPAGGNYSAVFTPRKVMKWVESVPYTDYESRWVPVERPGICERYVCRDDAQNESPSWNRFFRAGSKAEKTKALADAVKGIGDVSAEKLVAGRYFSSKPRSWTAFVNEIERAKNNGTLPSNIVYNVTVKYKADNMANLGYEANSCSIEQYNCTVFEDKLIQFPVTRYRSVTRQKVMEERRREFRISVNNPILQNFETDVISVQVGDQDGDVSVHYPDAKTIYQHQIDLRGGRITFTGVDRVKLPLPRTILRGGDLTFQKGTDEAQLNLAVDAKYIPDAQNDGNDQLVIRYVVGRCKQNWLGYCKGDFAMDQPMYAQVTGSQFYLRIPIAKNERMIVKYSFARMNSRYYNEQYTPEVESSKVNRNK